MGRRRSHDPSHPPRWRHPCLHLQPVWTRQCRTRRTRAYHPLRICRQPASGQPPHQSRRLSVALSLRQRGSAPH
ncbi:hypothetical protein R0155_06035 [Pseudomonas monsensis]|nr:hypothetical protein [Pseudomonas monsensis]MDZ3825960.1 hypothetical protein [Pseudomonas monsensis]